jgi:predicted short-subunit dehydrogenase-like oxidoreductase (DUF2520 family)
MRNPIPSTLNIIGGGRVGRTLGSLWQGRHAFVIQDVLSGTPHSARSAVAFIGSGRAVDWLEEMRPADVWMLTPPDGKIVHSCEALARSGLLRSGDIVFHCSGAMTSAELASASAAGALVASVHPLKTFADPAAGLRTFAGTFCGAEGERAALDVLRPAFEDIGATLCEIDPRFKSMYHAASVMVCNELVALMESGLLSYEKSGLARATALRVMEPLVRETIANVFSLGTTQALTGPIARGDHEVVARHIDALAAWDPRLAAIYRALGVLALDLARAQGGADAESLAQLERLLAQVVRSDISI